MRVSSRGLNQLGPPPRVPVYDIKFLRKKKVNLNSEVIKKYRERMSFLFIKIPRLSDKMVFLRSVQNISSAHRRYKPSLPKITIPMASED